MAKHHLETLQKEEHLCKKTSWTLSAQRRKSLEDERSFGESSIEEEEEEHKNDVNNTETQKKLGIDINMIGAREETLGKT